MYRSTYSTEFKGEVQTITLKRDPFYYGLGIYTDTSDTKWDVHAVIGGEKPYVQARRIDGHAIHSTATDATWSSCAWDPYYVRLASSALIKVKSAYKEKEIS